MASNGVVPGRRRYSVCGASDRLAPLAASPRSRALDRHPVSAHLVRSPAGPWNRRNGPGRRPSAQSEDCLSLTSGPRVSTLGIARSWSVSMAPFLSGSGSGILYRGGLLAREHDVVVVTINHRLGLPASSPIRPWPTMHSPGSTANRRPRRESGLADQVAALDWVRETLAFAGDRQRDPVRRVGWRHERRHAHGGARGKRALPPGHRAVGAAYTHSVEWALDQGDKLARHLGVACTRSALEQLPSDQLVAGFGDFVACSGADDDPARPCDRWSGRPWSTAARGGRCRWGSCRPPPHHRHDLVLVVVLRCRGRTPAWHRQRRPAPMVALALLRPGGDRGPRLDGDDGAAVTWGADVAPGPVGGDLERVRVPGPDPSIRGRRRRRRCSGHRDERLPVDLGVTGFWRQPRRCHGLDLPFVFAPSIILRFTPSREVARTSTHSRQPCGHRGPPLLSRVILGAPAPTAGRALLSPG